LPLNLILGKLVAQRVERGGAGPWVQSAAEAALVGIELLTQASPVQRYDLVLEIDGDGGDADALY
jgi:hypothetical protein